MLNGNVKIILLTVGQIRKTQHKGLNNWKKSGRRVKVELDLSNYATKANLKNATGVDTLTFARQIDLASLKSNVDKLDIDKFKQTEMLSR